MPSCAFLRCTNDSKRKNKAHGITFHAFPTDEAWKRKWLTVVRTQRYEPEWMSTKNSRICSIHFHADHVYTTNRGRRRITKGAVPFFQPAMVSADYATLALSPKSSDAESIDSIRSTRKTPKKGLGKGQTVKHKKNNKKVKKSDGLRGVLKKLKRKIIISEEHFSEVFLKAEAAEHYLKLTSTKNTKKTRVPFSSRLREFALTLHLYSPVGYRYVRKVFDNALPHPGILKKWHENHTAAPGFTGQAFAALKKKYTTAKKRLLCALIVGEMDLHRRPLWNGKKAVGSVNYGIGGLNSDKIASKAYVMLVVSLEQNWKLPVGYFLVDGLTAACRANLIRTCLTKCWDNGVDIIALTCDGCGPNIIAANLLGCELDDIDNLKTTFKHPSPLSKIDVAVFIDPSDMMKLVRNIFESRRLILDCEGREIKWQLLSNLLKLQRSETLTFADKSNPKHIEFRNQILTVKTGTQLLSMSVAKSLKMCKELLKSTRFQNIDGTVQFIENFNNIFDILNSKEGEEGFKSPISSENKIDSLVFIEQMRGYLCSLEICVKTRRTVKGRIATKVERKKIVESMCKTGIVGFIVCIESLKHLYTTLVENNNVEHIATRRFSLDHLKLFFRVFCRHGGS